MAITYVRTVYKFLRGRSYCSVSEIRRSLGLPRSQVIGCLHILKNFGYAYRAGLQWAVVANYDLPK